MGYENIAPLTEAQLAVEIVKPPERDYPSLACKWETSPAHWEDMVRSGEIWIPDGGPWHIARHPNRMKPEAVGRTEPLATPDSPISEERVAQWHKMGLLTDTLGRVLHPRAAQLLTTPGVGMFTGPGFNYGYGPKVMGNLMIRRVRLVPRARSPVIEYATTQVLRSSLVWGLPGGYPEEGETPEETAFREAEEEAGIQRSSLGNIDIREVHIVPKGFRRDTLHAWGEDSFTCVESIDNPGLEGVTLQINDPKEIVAVRWMGVEEIVALKKEDTFMNAHAEQVVANEKYIQMQGAR